MASYTNQTEDIEWQETYKCRCRLDASVCNNKQRWNKDKCRCECREELSDKERCDKGFIWIPSNCNWECDKSCNIGEYLDYKNCKCRQKRAGSLVEECRKNIDKNEMIYNETINVSLSDCKCGSYKPYIVLFVVVLVRSVIIIAVFIYFHWYSKKINNQFCLRKDNFRIKFNPSTQTTIYGTYK